LAVISAAEATFEKIGGEDFLDSMQTQMQMETQPQTQLEMPMQIQDGDSQVQTAAFKPTSSKRIAQMPVYLQVSERRAKRASLDEDENTRDEVCTSTTKLS